MRHEATMAQKKMEEVHSTAYKTGIDLTDKPLTIGGKMHLDFYDKRYVNDLNKWVQRIDKSAKVGKTQVETEPGKYEEVWQLKITPKLQEEIKRGLELSKAQRTDENESAVA